MSTTVARVKIPTPVFNIRVCAGTDFTDATPTFEDRDGNQLNFTGYTSIEVLGSQSALIDASFNPDHTIQLTVSSGNSLLLPKEFAYAVRARDTLGNLILIVRGDDCVLESLPV